MSFWEQPEQVEKFASRDPDHRLVELVERFAEPGRVGVLDLGCAGGRNAVFLARKGFDVHAVDASAAMVQRTRERLADLVGCAEAIRRARRGRMDDLSGFQDGRFHLVVALGVYHNARSPDEWDRALAETSRVLRPGGLLLVSVFTPRTRLGGATPRRVEDATHVYEGFPSGRVHLVEAGELDAAMARHGLVPECPTDTVAVETDGGRRVTVNGQYRKR